MPVTQRSSIASTEKPSLLTPTPISNGWLSAWKIFNTCMSPRLICSNLHGKMVAFAP